MILITTGQVAQFTEQEVTLQARITNLIETPVCDDAKHISLTLSDCEGDVQALVWADKPAAYMLMSLHVDEHPALEVTGRIAVLNGKLTLRLNNVYVISAAHITNSARLMPQSWIPNAAANAWRKLIAFIDELESTSLRDFLNTVLMDESIGKQFVNSRASGENHRKFQGGLLVHSMEVADLVGSIAELLNMPTQDKEISQIAGLLHDLGKVQTVGISNPRPMPPKLFSHEAQSLLLLATHLKRLRDSSQEEAWILTHLLERLATDKSSLKSCFIGEDIVRYADYLSAANDMGKSGSSFLGMCGYATLHPNKSLMQVSKPGDEIRLERVS